MSDSPATDQATKQFELGVLLGQTRTIDRLLQGLLEFTQSAPQSGSVEEIHRSMPEGVSPTLLEDALGYMEAAGWLDAEFRDGIPRYRVDPDRIVQVLSGARRMLQVAQQVEAQRQPDEFELVCTLPGSDPVFDSYHPVDFGMGQLTSSVLELCGTADRRIRLASPFLEKEGIEWLLPGIESALEQGVQVDLLSKQLDEGSANSHALAPLVQLDKETNTGLVRIFDYYEETGEEEQTYPAYTLHTKLVIVDDRAAYIGSSNFTENAFTRYLETGVIVRGEQVGGLGELVDRLLRQSADQIYPET